MYFIDSHAHLDDSQYTGDIDLVIGRALKNNIRYIISIAQDLDSSRKTVALAQKYESLFATIGIHPHEAKTAQLETYSVLRKLAGEPKVVAIGEIGLDYHYDHSPREVQKEIFHELMSLANELKLPVVIHSREAEVDTLSILNEFCGSVIGVMHCFSGNQDMLNQVLDLGYYISIAGPVTFKKTTNLQKIVTIIPEDRLLIETDSPYLAPVPHRGERNEPAYVIGIAEKIAELRNTTIDKIGSVTVNNTQRLFKLPTLDGKSCFG